MEKSKTEYSNWSPEQLIDRVTLLEQQLKELSQKYPFLPPEIWYLALNIMQIYNTTSLYISEDLCCYIPSEKCSR